MHANYRIVASRSTSRLMTPRLKFNSISNMGCQKNKSCPNELKFCEDSRNPKSIRCWKFQPSIFKNKKVLFLKNICGMLVFETLKNKNCDFLNSNTCFCLRLYSRIHPQNFFDHIVICICIYYSNKYSFQLVEINSVGGIYS